MIPLSTITVTVTEPADTDLYAEPYAAPAPRKVTATRVRAVLDYPTTGAAGREQLAGGEQSVWDFRLICDPVPLSRVAEVTDNASGTTYRVVWVMTYPEHVEAGLRVVEGEV